MIEKAEATELPLMHLSGWLGKCALPRVDWNEAACVNLALDELRSRNLTRLLVLPLRKFRVNYRMRRSLLIEGRRREFEIFEITHWVEGLGWMDDIERLADEVMRLPFPIGCYYPHSSVLFSLQKALQSQGAEIPRDVSFVTLGKDVQDTVTLATPSLSAVLPDFWQQGYRGAQSLIDFAEGKPPLHSIQRIPPVGVVHRESTGAMLIEDATVARLFSLLREHPLSELTISFLVEKVGLSRRSLKKRFQIQTGKTLHEALTERRMEEANRQLQSTSQNLEAIALSLGYSSLAYFATAFKRANEITPGAWRKTHQDEV